MSSKKMLWKVNVTHLETIIPVGIYKDEQEPQRVIVNAKVEYEQSPNPKSITDCFDYNKIHKLVTQEWKKHDHTPLLENYIFELLIYIFQCDDKVKSATVSICKPDIYKEAERVGVEATWTREDFLQFIQ